MSYQDVRGFYEDYEDPSPCSDCGSYGYDNPCSICREIRDLIAARSEAFEAGFPYIPETPRLAQLIDFRDGRLVECEHGHGKYPAFLGCYQCEDLRIDESIAWSIEHTEEIFGA